MKFQILFHTYFEGDLISCRKPASKCDIQVTFSHSSSQIPIKKISERQRSHWQCRSPPSYWGGPRRISGSVFTIDVLLLYCTLVHPAIRAAPAGFALACFPLMYSHCIVPKSTRLSVFDGWWIWGWRVFHWFTVIALRFGF